MLANWVTIILMVFALLAVDVPPTHALKQSSKRDCAVCHVMWIDAFKTEQRTLIPWQPGNVLMQDTQGVVSSEDVCYSCHDGYVNDSRAVLWKYNNHSINIKPSKDISVPPDLPMNVKGELYCGTCHSPHGIGAAPEDNPLGFTSFFRVKNVDSSLCENCHTAQAAFKATNGHFLGKSEKPLPAALFDYGSRAASDSNKIICQTCHRMHGARGQGIIVVDNTASRLCTTCHTSQKPLIDSQHDLRVTQPGYQNSRQQSVARSGPCSACHVSHNAAGKRLWARKVTSGNLASQVCLSCHGANGLPAATKLGRHSHPIQQKVSQQVTPGTSLPLFLDGFQPAPEGLIQCLTCHDAHRWNPTQTTGKSLKETNGDGSNSFLRLANDGAAALCVGCHADKQTVNRSDHNLAVTAPQAKNRQGLTVVQSGTCSACHVPHNALAHQLWARPLAARDEIANQMCTDCHRSEGAASAKQTGSNDHPLGITLPRAVLPPPSAMGNLPLPLYESTGKQSDVGRMACLTCHDPHRWTSAVSANHDAQYAANREGSALNSFLRRPNSPSSLLCGACHATQMPVDGSAHDLRITAPSALNVLGQTAAESGTCGACHLAHNSPHALKLWAQPFPPLAADQSAMDALCLACHAKGKNAAARIPAFATHPKDTLISNVMRFNTGSGNYTPLFDQTGAQVQLGELACPSCHNAHQWHLPGTGRTSTGNQDQKGFGRFLRVRSAEAVCIDCHGPDGLYRYLYFHTSRPRIPQSPTGAPPSPEKTP